jgi:ferredoxin
MKACPVEGGIYKRPDGLIIIDPVKCTGCGECVDACPYACIYFNEKINIAQKCTGCAHLLDKGWNEPRCVDACMTDAIKFGEGSEFGEIINKAEVLHPEYGSKPRVYYLNLPKKFIGGTVYDPKINEIVEGATCTLTDLNSGDTLTSTTDGFGDFWFEGLEEGTFSLKIDRDGKIKEIDSIGTEKDVNLGDIPLS